MEFPSQEASANAADCDEQQRTMGPEADDTPTLLPAESIKFDGRAVLCLEVEAAADDCPPFQAQTVDTELLRLLDLLLAVSVLLFCLVTGNLSLDSYTCTVGLAVTAVLASVAVVGLQQYCSASSLETAPAHRASTQAHIKASAQQLLANLGAQVTSAVLAATDFPATAMRHSRQMLKAYRRYMACLEAMEQLAALHDQSFSTSTTPQQQQLKHAAETSPSGWLFGLPAAASKAVAAVCLPWTAYRKYMACMEAIAQITADEQGQALFSNQQQQPTKSQGQSQTPRGFLSLVRSAAASTVAAICLPWTAYQRYMACVKVITELGEEDDVVGMPLFPCQQQQQGPASAQPAGFTNPVFTPAGFKAYLNALHAVAALAGAEDSTDQQQQQQLRGAASLAVAAKCANPTPSSVLNPASAVRSLLASLQAVGQIGRIDAGIEPATSLDLDHHQQQQQQQQDLWLQKLSAKDSKASMPSFSEPPAPSSTPVGHSASAMMSFFKLGACLEAIAHLAKDEAMEQNSTDKHCTHCPSSSSSSSSNGSTSKSSVDASSSSSGSDGTTCSKWAAAAGPVGGVVGTAGHQAAADSPGVLGGFMRCMEALGQLGMD